MIVLACDPGYRQSAFVGFDGERILHASVQENEKALLWLHFDANNISEKPITLVIEQMQLFTSNFGVGQEIFDSVFWSGRFVQTWTQSWARILRSKVRGHLKASKGGDAAVRASLIARFGPYKEQAIGTKKAQGPLYGIKGDMWSALAIAATYHDLHAGSIRPGVQPEF